MKKIAMIVLVLMVGAAAYAKKPGNPVKVVSKTMDVVYFKVSADMIGASIEVYDANGKMIDSTTVTDHKVIVDFYAEPSGEYTIHVKKDSNDNEIVYSKHTASHAELADHNTLVIHQM
jgi:hypothetical protein